mmetsp:Transcript_3534/g.7432  ORF Transcript_3534/g.7432 Transcript_3534/m.7432 type:complete len:204 (+) Transcript_3534:334-945(+)
MMQRLLSLQPSRCLRSPQMTRRRCFTGLLRVRLPPRVLLGSATWRLAASQLWLRRSSSMLRSDATMTSSFSVRARISWVGAYQDRSWAWEASRSQPTCSAVTHCSSSAASCRSLTLLSLVVATAPQPAAAMWARSVSLAAESSITQRRAFSLPAIARQPSSRASSSVSSRTPSRSVRAPLWTRATVAWRHAGKASPHTVAPFL